MIRMIATALAAFALLATSARAEETKPADTKADTKPAKKAKKHSKKASKKAEKPAEAAPAAK